LFLFREIERFLGVKAVIGTLDVADDGAAAAVARRARRDE
jgi:hypothetical protein